MASSTPSTVEYVQEEHKIQIESICPYVLEKCVKKAKRPGAFIAKPPFHPFLCLPGAFFCYLDYIAKSQRSQMLVKEGFLKIQRENIQVQQHFLQSVVISLQQYSVPTNWKDSRPGLKDPRLSVITISLTSCLQ